MKAIINFFKQKWAIQLLGIAALCALVWFAGPLVAFANRTPLEPEFNRLLAILFIVIAWAVYNLFAQARANQKDRQLIAELAAPQVDPTQATIEEAQNEELTGLHRKFEKALQLLKQKRLKGKRDKQYLYELPWYVIIGAPGCGKTTLLINSGLDFPLSGHMDSDDVPGVGGTRNCDWLFTDEAIFLDTAGRYTTQDSHQPVDAAAWRGFLDLIKRYRPRRPINGVLVTMSVPDLIQKTDEWRRQHAKDVRQRILELNGVLGIRFPVYMVFTKCDKVAGFSDFFSHLSEEEREQVWGKTFPGEDSEQTENHIARFAADFDELLHRLSQWTFRRIQEERDIRRRSLILDFPRQMALLKPAIKGFLHETFGTSSFEAKPWLRGVYFSSATQEGSPIDRVMGILASTYGLDRQEKPFFSGKGKSFFITRLLKEVVFPEAGVTGVDPRVERRHRWLHWAACTSLVVLTLGIIAVWLVSYGKNKDAATEVDEEIKKYQNLTREAAGWDGEARSLLARLNILQASNDVYKDPSFSMGFGLYQGDKIQSGINRLYAQLLKNNLLALIKVRLEEHMVARMRGDRDSHMTSLYELLKVYLMLGNPKRMDSSLAQAWIGRIWEQSFPREPQIQDQLHVHSDNLLKLDLEALELNEPLIADARRILNKEPLYARVYAHLQSKAQQELSSDFRLQDVLPPHSDQVFTTANGQALQTMTIPGLYTHNGYNAFFKKQGLEFVRRALAENWVLNNFAADESSDLPRLYDDLQKHYFEQYKRHWRGLLDNLNMKRFRGFSQAIQFLDRLSGPETPLRPLLEAVESNTSLTRTQRVDSSGTTLEQEKDSEQVPPFENQASQLARELEQYFEELNYLVRRSGKSPQPLDNVLRSLNEIRDFMMQISSAAKSEEQALKIAMERVRGAGASDIIKRAQMEFARLPEPLKSWFLPLTTFGWKLTLNSAKSELNAIWKTDVLAPYMAGLQGRYPLFKNSRHDATLTDFSRFFMPNGIIDQFFQNHLKPFVNTTLPEWRQVAMDNQAIGFSRRALRQFQYAARIRDSFFAGGGPTPSVQFELKPVYLDENIAAFLINLEGQTSVYRHGPARSSKFQWPGPQTNAGVRLTFQTVDGREVIQTEEGPWAWLRLLDKATVEGTNLPERFMVTFREGGFKARYELRANSVYNPFRLMELQNFRCPESF